MNTVSNSSDKYWFKDTNLTWFEQFMINIIKCGKIPKHVAIIMDGNRRYAKKVHLDQLNCYNLGFEKITNILKYSHHLGIEEVTIFAFSIENFKRDQSETDLLMNLAIDKFKLLLDEREELIKNNICIRFIGNLELLPNKLRKLISELMLFTNKHDGKCLNICMAYTSTYEFENIVVRLLNAKNQNQLNLDELDKLTIDDLDNCLLTNKFKKEPELLIRTSGEIRLSDFLLWQCNYSILSFTNVLWPECTFLEFSKLILKYQLDQLINSNNKLNERIDRSSNSKKSSTELNNKLKFFIDNEFEKKLINAKELN